MIQRVRRASVTVDGAVVGDIGHGLVVLVGVEPTDGEREAVALADKLAGLRVFADEDGRMNVSVVDASGSVLVVSQFTLLGDVRRGRRPSFVAAAEPDVAAPVIERLVERLAEHGLPVAEGRFGASMQVELVNDGPVTLILEVAGGRVR